MSTFKQILFFTFLFLSIGLSAQNTNEYIIFTKNKGDIAAVNNVANTMNSEVLDYPANEENLALLKWDGVPFYYESFLIDDIVKVVDKIQGKEELPPAVDIDGGGINFTYTPPSDNQNNTSANCTTPYSNKYIPGSPVTVGIFDTGLNYEIAQDNGYAFKEVIEIGNIEDFNGHGTHVSTVIDEIYHSRIDNNLNYVIGSPFNSTGGASIYSIISSIEQALNQYESIDIINFSFTYPYMSTANLEEVDNDPFRLLLEANNHVLFVCAAGNDAFNIEQNTINNVGDIYTIPSYYPGAFNLPNLISVGSHKCDHGVITKSTFSNYGNESIDFAAEGEFINGLDHNGNLIWMSGTSQAAAVTTGAAVAIKSKWPELTPEELKCNMIDLGFYVQGFDEYFKSSKVLNLDFVLSLPNLPNCSDDDQNSDGLFGLSGNSGTNTLESQLKAFPNPFDNNLNIEYFTEFNSPITFDIFTMNGKLVHSFNENVVKGNNKFVLNFNNIVFSNQYIIRITSNGKTETRKINRF